jgi:hypothetical protein
MEELPISAPSSRILMLMVTASYIIVALDALMSKVRTRRAKNFGIYSRMEVL